MQSVPLQHLVLVEHVDPFHTVVVVHEDVEYSVWRCIHDGVALKGDELGARDVHLGHLDLFIGVELLPFSAERGEREDQEKKQKR